MLYIYARLVEGNRNLHEAAYELLFEAVKCTYGDGSGDLQLKKTEYGKPYFENAPYHFSIAHTEGMVTVAISEVPVGIDVESMNRTISDKVSKRFLKKENAELVDWLRYESIGKMRGCGIPLENLESNDAYGCFCFPDVCGYSIVCVCEGTQCCDGVIIL